MDSLQVAQNKVLDGYGLKLSFTTSYSFRMRR